MIEIRTSMKSEKDFLLWEKNFKRIPKIPSVLYPEQVRYEDKGCCGSSGIAHVTFLTKRRSSINDIRTFWPRRSRSGKTTRKGISVRLNSGFCSIL